MTYNAAFQKVLPLVDRIGLHANRTGEYDAVIEGWLDDDNLRLPCLELGSLAVIAVEKVRAGEITTAAAMFEEMEVIMREELLAGDDYFSGAFLGPCFFEPLHNVLGDLQESGPDGESARVTQELEGLMGRETELLWREIHEN